MTPDQEATILDRYPALFDLEYDPTGTAMGFGLKFDGSGWLPLLDRMCAKIEPLAARLEAEGETFKILDVKQKLGTLRLAYIGATDEILAAIAEAKEEASRTCESCGAAGELRQESGYLTVICDPCHLSYQARIGIK